MKYYICIRLKRRETQKLDKLWSYGTTELDPLNLGRSNNFLNKKIYLKNKNTFKHLFKLLK